MWIRLNDICVNTSSIEKLEIKGDSVFVTRTGHGDMCVKFASDEDAGDAFEKACSKMMEEESIDAMERRLRIVRKDNVRQYITDTRALTVLDRVGIKTMGELELMREASLLKHRGIGRHTIGVVEDAMTRCGMTLKR